VESKQSAHDKNTQIHTSQSEKDDWNGKAVIKGLESVNGVEKNTIIDKDANNATYNSVYYARLHFVTNPLNYPMGAEEGVLITMQEYGTPVLQQTYSDLILAKSWVRVRTISSIWQPWKLIAQDQDVVKSYTDNKLQEAKAYTDIKVAGIQNAGGIENKTLCFFVPVGFSGIVLDAFTGITAKVTCSVATYTVQLQQEVDYIYNSFVTFNQQASTPITSYAIGYGKIEFKGFSGVGGAQGYILTMIKVRRVEAI
jgi:hypothetical protein